MSHILTFTVEVEENDSETEAEICNILLEIFLNSVTLLDYCATSIATSNITKEN